ncbi:putative forkhead transcription factor fkh1 [Diaporthe ampelina]|uniref:Putative forkhead transcription factor fkh1 n=1 Tax=Diaporthe ampelina TaxID=1214573 RepID=A0A0G2FGU8_9PEZI|nr:putative forkhead transcription factor fkh1 [Diaporthe ampelina]
MPSPSKRTQRARRDSTRKELASDRPDNSSPSRPAKRRKKTEEISPSPKENIDEEPESSLAADSSLVADNSIHDAKPFDFIVDKVAEYLKAPANVVIQASKDHSNSRLTGEDGINAYAKIVGLGWTFYVKKTTINIGRSSDPPQPVDPNNDEEFIHVDLGPSKMISRRHASIFFSTNYGGGTGRWVLHVKGRNGVRINGAALPVDEAQALSSGDVLEIATIEMMMVLPEQEPLRISEQYLDRAGLSERDLPTKTDDARVNPPSSNAGRPSSSHGIYQARQGRGQQAIAPAPPDYKRPGTPPSVRSRTQTVAKASPLIRGNATGNMILSTNDMDLSLEDNKGIKPQYSYAQMITQAIMSTHDEKLNLNGIYTYIMSNYAYYRHQQPAGWQNSIRHNLSLNKAFEKVARSTDEPGKGMKWQITAECRDEMVKNAWKGGRGGHRGSSNPSSPSGLNYITQEDGSSLVTPAPLKIHPRLAPPSTAQRPSQHMPMSSPAPFWKFAEYGSTPIKPLADISPSKNPGPIQQSSSPPRIAKSPTGSPTQNGRSATHEPIKPEEPEDEEEGIDLTKGFQSISSYHESLNASLSKGNSFESTNGSKA